MAAEPASPGPAPDDVLTLGILQTDSVRPEFLDEHGDYPAMFRALLTGADGFGGAGGVGSGEGGTALAFRDYDVKGAGVLPASVDECDGWLITGSRDSVYDDLPWIRELEDFVRAVHEARRPLVGICFGHQLVARALGGEARAADAGWAVGRHASRLVARPPWMSDPADGFAILSSHKDQVTRLPEGATLLATNDFCPNAAFTIGDHLLCIQGHPEFAPAYSRALMDFRRELLGEEVWASGIASLEAPIHQTRVARWMLAFLRAAVRRRQSA